MKQMNSSLDSLRASLLSAAMTLLVLPAMVSAQEMDHSKMSMQSTQAEPADHSTMDHAAMGHDMPMPAADKPMESSARSARDVPAQGETAEPVDHSAMDHSSMGHDMPMPGTQPARTVPITPIPALTDADRAAAAPPTGGHTMHGDSIQRFVLLDRLEAWNADSGTGMAWEGSAWFGGDRDRLWLRSEGERVDGVTESADLEILYGRSVARWWDVLVGVRHDFKPGASQDFLAIGVMGLAPQKFEVEATAYLGERGQTSARMEAEYDLLLTNRLVLQPLIEATLYGKDDARRGIGSGLSTVEAGLRLRYEVIREFAPYVGIVHERAFGQTADYRRDENEDIDDTRIVAGFRIWF